MTEAGELSDVTSGDAEAGRELRHEEQVLGVLQRVLRLRGCAGGRAVEAVEGVEAAANQLPGGGPGRRGGAHQTLAEDARCLMNTLLAPATNQKSVL